jgi:hypothetical protein
MPTLLTAAQRTPGAVCVNFTVDFDTAARFRLGTPSERGSVRPVSPYLNLSVQLATGWQQRRPAINPA